MGKSYVEGSLIVSLRSGLSKEEKGDIVKAVAARSGKVTHDIEMLNTLVVEFNPGDERDWKEWLEKEPGVESVGLNRILSVC